MGRAPVPSPTSPMSVLGDPYKRSGMPLLRAAALPSVRQLLCHMTLCCDGAAQRTPVAPATAEEAWWPSEGTGYPAQWDQSLAPGDCVQAWILLLSGIWQGGGTRE